MSFTMDFNVETRKKQLESLDQFISTSRNNVNNILNCLGWTAKEVLKNSSVRICSINSSHKVSTRHIDEHIQKCSLKSEGYDLRENFLSEPINDPKCSIMIDDLKKVELIAEKHKKNPDFKTGWNGQNPVPKTVDRNIITYSGDERLCFYEYSIKHTSGPLKPNEFTVYKESKDDDKPVSYEEKLAQIRDARRRRIKYRSVHTNKKSYTEVIREVIDGQMEIFKDWLTDKKKPKDGNKKNDFKQTLTHTDEVREKKLNDFDNLTEKSTKHNSSSCRRSSKSRDRSKKEESHRSRRENSRSRRSSRSSKDNNKSDSHKERQRNWEHSRSRERHSSSHRSHRSCRDSRDHSRERSIHRYRRRRS